MEDISEDDIENQVKNIKKSRRLLKVVDDGSVDLVNCEYKIHAAGFGGKKNCNFNIRKIPKEIQKALRWCTKTQSTFVIVPAGTKMYRGTLVSPSMKNIKIVPWVPSKNFGWFTSTIEHQGNINYTQIEEYKTRVPLLCIFEPELHSSGLRGNSYYKHPVIASQNARTKCKFIYRASELLNERDQSLTLDGYIGCDECEIGLIKDNITTKLKYRGLVKTKSLSYID